MKLIDYFFYVLMCPKFKKAANKEVAVTVADTRVPCGLLSWWFSSLIVSILFFAGLLGVDISAFLAINPLILIFIILGLPTIIITIRYFENDKRSLEIIKWRKKLSEKKVKVLYIAFLVLFWGMPITAFVTFRLYKFGYLW